MRLIWGEGSENKSPKEGEESILVHRHHERFGGKLLNSVSNSVACSKSRARIVGGSTQSPMSGGERYDKLEKKVVGGGTGPR